MHMKRHDKIQFKTLLPINQFTQVEKKILPHTELYTSRKEKPTPQSNRRNMLKSVLPHLDLKPYIDLVKV